VRDDRHHRDHDGQFAGVLPQRPIVPLVGKSVTVMVTATTGMPIAFIEGTLTRGACHGSG